MSIPLLYPFVKAKTQITIGITLRLFATQNGFRTLICVQDRDSDLALVPKPDSKNSSFSHTGAGYGFSATKTERIQSLGKPIDAAKNSSDNMHIILSSWPGFLLSHISFVDRRKLAVIVLLLLVIVGIGLQHQELVEGVGKQSDVNG